MKTTDVPRIPIAKWSSARKGAKVEEFFSRPTLPPECLTAAAELIAEVRDGGDRAVARITRRFDKARLTAADFRVGEQELQQASKACDPAFKRAARDAHQRVRDFANAGLRKDWSMKTPAGGKVGERYHALERVAVYIPGGAAPLASTAIMSATLAAAAGVEHIVAFTPCNARGEVNPMVLHALQIAGATEIYRIGGVPAIAAAAYGTETIPKVQMIAGPGNAYVTAAKKLVYGDVALDMVAGPSEIAVLADEHANPTFVAADLLSQAEHGTGLEKSLLVTTSAELAKAVSDEIRRQTVTLTRAEQICEVLKHGTLAAVVPDLEQGCELINRFAPEHFELMVKSPAKWLKRIRTAGAVFVGPWTPESAGDFAAGPSHVLPTGGTAALFSGLTAESFRRKSSLVSLTKADLTEMLPTIQAFGRVETLDGHARAAEIRFE